MGRFARNPTIEAAREVGSYRKNSQGERMPNEEEARLPISHRSVK
jgi:hypothetical protein